MKKNKKMISEYNLEVQDILKELDDIHLSVGPLYQKVNSFKALININNDDTEVIYNLVETHSPGLRNKTVYRYEKLLAVENLFQNMAQLELSKESLSIKCSTYPKEKKIDEMLNQIQQMPKEWTVVQLTPQFNPMEIWNEDKDTYYTNSVHISVFSCGQKEKPFFVTVDAPRDAVNGRIIELAKEMISILNVNKQVLVSHSGARFKNHKEKSEYCDRVHTVEDRLKLLIKDIQNLWLKEWRCLLTGKFADENLENELKKELNAFFTTEATDLKLTHKIETILCCVMKNYLQLGLNEVKRIVQYCFPNIGKSLLKSIVNQTRTISHKVFIESGTAKRHPVILILHESLDCFPWEMIDVLVNHPVSRLPSLHFLYCLFKEHENDITDGYKIITDYDKGTYVVNPNADLPAMEDRMMKFFNYWTPDWFGSSGCEPSKDEFFELLTSSDIFSYNGHGSGSSYIPIDKLQRSHVKAIVLLFGCGSTRIVRTDPQVEMFGHYYMYLIARCPCVVGMLWEVTDKATDELSTDFMSYWVPSKAPKHWKSVDKHLWRKGEEKLIFLESQATFEDEQTWEPDLLRALILAKKSSSNTMTKAACVARGLPVKIKK